MPEDSDKYPAETDRRRFVKGVVGGATLAAVGATGATAVDAATSPAGEGGGITQYFGIELVDGPAPRGMPQIPVELDDEGYLRGIWPEVEEVTEEGRTFPVAEEQLGGIRYSNEWFQYCGVQTYPGIQPNADQDNYFRYTESSNYDWQNENVEAGDRVHIDDFEDYQDWGNEIGQGGLGKPASATWRSQDVPSDGTIPVQIIRSTQIEEQAQNGENSEWLQASTAEGFIVNLNKCTHFCCVPGFKQTEGSARFNAEDLIYCQCHQSVYDPFSQLQDQFVALPRPESDGGAGSAGGGGETGGGGTGDNETGGGGAGGNETSDGEAGGNETSGNETGGNETGGE